MPTDNEVDRLIEVYRNYAASEETGKRFSAANSVNRAMVQERTRVIRQMLGIGRVFMLKLGTPLAAGAFVTLTCLGAAPAKADVPVTYVSGNGTDTDSCSSPANPCRTFQFAVNQTAAGGEVKALDPADYGPVNITKSISITGVVGAGIEVTSPNQTAVNIFSSNSLIVVNLANLTLDGPNPPSGTGVAFSLAAPEFAGTSVTIINCIARNFGTGIGIVGGGPTSFVKVLIENTIVTNNSIGLSLNEVQGTLDHFVTNLNANGIIMGRDVLVTAVDSVAANNTGTGISTGGGSVLQLAHTTVTGNGTGVTIGNVGVSFGDNHISGNGTNLTGPLTKVGTQ
jgi:hypothetical protein